MASLGFFAWINSSSANLNLGFSSRCPGRRALWGYHGNIATRRGISLMLVGGFNHLEKYESQWEGLSHILWKIKTV